MYPAELSQLLIEVHQGALPELQKHYTATRAERLRSESNRTQSAAVQTILTSNRTTQ
jgi:hypothetical protein